MENLRWILILAGIAILVLLYFSGRSRARATGNQHRIASAVDNDDFLDPLDTDDMHTDPTIDFDDDDFSRPGQAPVQSGRVRRGAPVEAIKPVASDYEYEFEEELGRTRGSSPGFTSIAQKIELISARLSPKRRQRVAQSEPADLDNVSPSDPEFASKIVTLHVVAAQNTVLNGEQLLDVFERRGYHYGDLNIFHSMHKGEVVFSIAKMIEPGYFDIQNVASFATPGITLILQLPGPVAADVAFEVLISEAFEMANELNASVLDGDRNTLSKQTRQHMLEGIYEYMHRQKYFGNVPVQ